MSNTQLHTNQFLASLSRADYARLAPWLKPIALEQGALLYEPGDEIKQVYFPQDRNDFAPQSHAERQSY